MDENDLSQEKKWYYEQRAKSVVTNLQKKGMNAQYFQDNHLILFLLNIFNI